MGGGGGRNAQYIISTPDFRSDDRKAIARHLTKVHGREVDEEVFSTIFVYRKSIYLYVFLTAKLFLSSTLPYFGEH